MFRCGLLRLLPALLLTGCAFDAETDVADVGDSAEAAAAVPWKQASKWPFSVGSPRLLVHYQAAGDVGTAQLVLADVENAWQRQVVEQGARPPIDGGTVGGDARYDVWLQRGLDSIYV